MRNTGGLLRLLTRARRGGLGKSPPAVALAPIHKASPTASVPTTHATHLSPALPTSDAHLSASLAMAVFLCGSAGLAVLPELPGLQERFESATILATDEPQEIAKASLSATAESLILGALRSNVADDLTRIEAMPQTTTLQVRRGDTLMELLIGSGAPRVEAYHALEALKPLFDPRHLREGQEIEVTLAPARSDQANESDVIDVAASETEAQGTPSLLAIRLQPELTRYVEVYRDEDGAYATNEIEKPLFEKPIRAVATIDSSLFVAAADVGIPHEVIVSLIRLFSYDIDFQREIRKGDSFEVFFTRMVDEDGEALKEGHILYAALTSGGKTRQLWRYKATDDGVVDYYDENGKSAKKFLMRTPIDGARMSSGFGMRKHPILGYSKMHKGTDFAAPRGTPIMAAGSGTVEFAGRNGSYGNYIRIRHANGYKTAYAHLNGFARGIKKGARVTQGDIIAYVGTTGRSTGPHLHYEVLVSGHQVNPLSVRVPTGRSLEGGELTAFQDSRSTIQTEMANAELLGQVTTAGLPVTSTNLSQ